ncbi:hypothetical protein WJ09_24510 [Burkholderia vietnamiensis]|nr:hypothetical protein WJ09_24510 [Burkholderia vietnamiensis]
MGAALVCLVSLMSEPLLFACLPRSRRSVFVDVEHIKRLAYGRAAGLLLMMCYEFVTVAKL